MSGEAKNFGFIVPTPSKPSLGETKSGLFESLEEEIKPEIITRVVRNYEWSLIGSLRATRWSSKETSGAPVAASVDEESIEVIEKTKVGAYDATVLRADDAGALGAWLRKNSYSAPPSVEKWLQFYTDKKWFLTAFKVSAENAGENASLSPVRISFATEHPFYSYHEPETASTQRGGRSLRVFFVGDKQMEANIVSPSLTEKWQATAPFSSGLKHSGVITELGGVPADGVDGFRLAAFEDFSSPRGGFGDLYFSPSSNQSNLVPEPIVKDRERNFLIPLDVIGIIVLGIVVSMTLRRRDTSR